MGNEFKGHWKPLERPERQAHYKTIMSVALTHQKRPSHKELDAASQALGLFMPFENRLCTDAIFKTAEDLDREPRYWPHLADILRVELFDVLYAWSALRGRYARTLSRVEQPIFKAYLGERLTASRTIVQAAKCLLDAAAVDRVALSRVLWDAARDPLNPLEKWIREMDAAESLLSVKTTRAKQKLMTKDELYEWLMQEKGLDVGANPKAMVGTLERRGVAPAKRGRTGRGNASLYDPNVVLAALSK